MENTLHHFKSHGWMRVEQAFDTDAAARMRDAIWDTLIADGITRNDPSTWSVERPTSLPGLKNNAAFDAVGSQKLLAALDGILGADTYALPNNWGALFVAFPTATKWQIPTRGWHLDANYASALWPTRGVKTHALLGGVEPRGGGTLIVSGSHRLVHDWFKNHPPPPNARSADMRGLLKSHPYIRELHAEGDRDARIARLMRRCDEVSGVPLQVVENVGDAGDVILLHPLVLHVSAPNNSSRPRFLLSGGVTADQWGWGGKV
jgi:hypothetical protein